MITINLNSEEIKPLHKEQNQNITESSRLVIAEVTICLIDDHKKCSGKYIDSVTGKFYLKCVCSCHTRKKD